MKILWYFLAKLLAQPRITAYLIARAKLTPYTPILSVDGTEVYMERYWLFNPYPTQTERDAMAAAGIKQKWRFPISVRIHGIRTPDLDRHLHDHPWNARTVILRGGYIENRGGSYNYLHQGGSATLKFGKDFHRITTLYPMFGDDAVWTLFITGKFRGMWGFNKDGVKIPFKEYLRDTGDAMSKEKK